MRFRIGTLACAALVVALTTACSRGDAPAAGATPASTTPSTGSPEAEVQEWRAKHERDYRLEWVSIAGLHMLRPGPNTAGSAATNDITLPGTPDHIGRFVLGADGVRFEPAENAAVHLREAVLTAPLTLHDDSGAHPDELLVGDQRLVIHKSGEQTALRVRDPSGPLARNFQGFTWFPIDPSYRVTGRFVKDPAPHTVKVLNTYGDIDEYTTEGVIQFTLHGQQVSLRPFTTRPKRFYIVFKDASSGSETYRVARFLYSDLLDDGTTVLDFNMAYNPPCSFNPYTTCPIPLKENRLPVKVLAGEKAYVGQEPEVAR